MIRNPGVQALRFGLFRPLPRSLAATWRIDVSFSSWGYLDVSVHPVSFCMLCVHMQMHTHCSMRVPPFGNLRFIRYLLLTAAYRSLSRPSSASGAKASALCSFLLDQLPDVASSGLSFTIVTQCEMFLVFSVEFVVLPSHFHA